MNRLQIIALVGLGVLQGCSASDEAPERPPADAGRDTRTTPRVDAPSVDRLDAGGADAAETPAPPAPDADTPDAPMPPLDVISPPPDVGLPEVGPPRDVLPPPPPSDAPPPLDVAVDTTVPSCVVTFTVSSVRWDAPEGGPDAQAGARVVRLVGDAANIGSWAPTAGVLLAETVPGTWSGTAVFRDQQITEFKFVKVEGVTPEWETWTPYDSNRSLRVECFGDGGVSGDAADAGTVGDAPADRADGDGAPADVVSDAPALPDAGQSDADGGAQDAGAPGDVRVVPVPARGKTYAGVFGVRPPDATK